MATIMNKKKKASIFFLPKASNSVHLKIWGGFPERGTEGGGAAGKGAGIQFSFVIQDSLSTYINPTALRTLCASDQTSLNARHCTSCTVLVYCTKMYCTVHAVL